MFFLTLLFTLVIIGAIVFLLLHVRTPHYQVTEQHFIRLLTLVVTGQATENDWTVVMDMPVRNSPYLEDVRVRCQVIAENCAVGFNRRGYLFNHEGLEALRVILDELMARDRQPPAPE